MRHSISEARHYYLRGQQSEFDLELEMARSSLERISGERTREFTLRAIGQASRTAVTPDENYAPDRA